MNIGAIPATSSFVSLGVAQVTRLNWWWWALLGLLSLGQLQRWQVTPGIAINIHDVLLAAWTAQLFWQGRSVVPARVGKLLRRYAWQFGVVTGWIGLGWAVAVLTGSFHLTSVLFTARLGLYLTWVMMMWWTRSVPLRQLELGLVIMFGLMTWLGWLQYLVIPDTRILAVLGWDDHFFRLIGTQFDPNFMSILLVLGWLYISERWPVSLQQGARKVRSWWRKLVLLAVTVGLAVTFSRASYLAFGVVLALSFSHDIIAGRSQAVRRVAVTALLFLAAVLIAPKPGGEGVNLGRTSTVAARAETTGSFVAELQPRHWLIGQGLFNFQPADGAQLPLDTRSERRPHHATFPDSLPVTLLVSLGLPGAVAVGWVTLKLLWEWWPLQPVITMSWTAVLLHSLFNNTLFQSFVLLTLLAITLSEQVRFENQPGT